MGEVRLEQHPAVEDEDMADVYSFISNDSVESAGRVIDAVIDTFALLVREPDAGVLYRTENPKLRGIKMLPVTRYRNYLVFYRTTAECVRILYVVHGARNLVQFFTETPRA